MNLALVAIFRNEEHILKEFIEHHLVFGVKRFYLIDNASDDNSKKVLEPYINKGIVKYFYEPSVNGANFFGKEFDGAVTLQGVERQPQVASYNKVVPLVKEKWCIICDCDEFWYFQKPGWTLDRLETWANHRNVTQIIMPLKNFTSGGVIEQPESVRETFKSRNLATRTPYVPAIHKTLFRTSAFNKAGITAVKLSEGFTTCGQLRRKDRWFTNNYLFHTFYQTVDGVQTKISRGIKKYRDVDDSTYTDAIICGNHYMLQSREWFFNVKANRGICTLPALTKGETLQDFWQRRWDTIEEQKSVEDTTLIDLIKEGKY